MTKRYERDGFSNYVIYELPLEAPSFDIQMLARLSPSYVAKAELRYTDGNIQIYYHIERLQLGSVVFRKGKVDADLLCGLLKSIVCVLEEMKELLLDFDDLVFEIEQMYWDTNRNQAVFVYVPGYREPVWRQLKEFIEQLLPMVLPTDKKAMECIYNLYQEACDETLNIEVLKRYSEGDFVGSLTFPERVVGVQEVDTTTHRTQSESMELKVSNPDAYYVSEPGWKTFLRSIIDSLRGVVKKNKKADNEAARVIVQEENVELLSSQINEEYTQTTVLSVMEHIPVLKSVDGIYPLIKPGKEKMLIGRQDSVCNYVILDIIVSRIHASIENRDGELILMDLNSANGTFVNEKRIETKEETLLTHGDVVAFGNVAFVVV